MRLVIFNGVQYDAEKLPAHIPAEECVPIKEWLADNRVDPEPTSAAPATDAELQAELEAVRAERDALLAEKEDAGEQPTAAGEGEATADADGQTPDTSAQAKPSKKGK